MFIKRQLAIILMILIGFVTLAGHFINNDSLREFVDKDATQWYMIIAGFAAFLGCLNLFQLHLRKVAYKKDNWQYSILTLLGFFIMIVFGFFINGSDAELGPHLKSTESYFYWIYDYIYLPLASTMFALLAFFVASASYRAFRIRNFEASLLLFAGVLVMIGAVPFGLLIPDWFFAFLFLFTIFAFLAPLFKDKKQFYIVLASSAFFLLALVLILDFSFLNAKSIMAWIIAYPTVAGKKAIMIGIALGIVATSLRIIFGRDKSFLGD